MKFKFDYPELMTETVNGMRIYITPQGGAYPSITTVLGKTMPEEKVKALANWANAIGQLNAKKKTQDAADRGTAVHTLIERFLNGEEEFSSSEFSAEALNMFNALKVKLKKIDEIWCQEVGLYSDLLALAGRVDCIGVYKGEEAIIDFKTSSRLKSQEDIEDYRFQLCAYALMHNEMFGTNINKGVILMTSAAGFPQEFHVDLMPYVDRLFDRVQDFYKKMAL
jgi:ATP-dependent exoDNAse (exonuclease V) beta subunit